MRQNKQSWNAFRFQRSRKRSSRDPGPSVTCLHCRELWQTIAAASARRTALESPCGVPALEHYFFVLLIAIAVWAGLELRRRKLKAQPGAAAPADTQHRERDGAPAFGPTDTSALTARLHQLEAAFAPFSNSSAHPRELADHSEFQQAADLLADPAVPLDIVMQYAHGANWALSCAAFAALKGRHDRGQALDQVVAQFDRLAPWAMYFALEYFLGTEPRPPVGAAVGGAKELWRDNPILPLLLQDYFARRADLGDVADFG